MTPDLPAQPPTIEEAIEQARQQRRSVQWLGAFFVTALLLLGGAIAYVILSYQPKTACQTDPGGIECQQLKIDSDLLRPPESACVITILAGFGCPALGLSPAEGSRLLARLDAGKPALTSDQGRTDASEPNAAGGDAGSGAPPVDGGGGGDLDGGNGDPGAPPQDPGPDPPTTPPDDGGEGPGPGPDPGGDPPPQPEEPTLGDQLGETIDSATSPVTEPACSNLPRTCDALGLP